jgi:hypothetical protein
MMSLDVIVAVIVVGAVLWRFAETIWSQVFRPSRRRVVKQLPVLTFKKRERSSNVQNPVQVRSAHQDAEPTSVQRSKDIVLTEEEFTLIARVFLAKGAGKTKQEAIETTWLCKKGAGDKWQKASRLYDLALGNEPPKTA